MSTKTDNRTAERIFAILLCAAGAAALAASVLLQISSDGVNGGTFPLLVSAAFLLFAVLNLIFVCRCAATTPRGSLSTVLWMMLLLAGVCAALLLHVPFWIVSPVFLFVACFVILRQTWLQSLIAAAATTGLVYLVFAVLFRVPLP